MYINKKMKNRAVMIFVGISCLVLLGFLTNEAGKNAKEGAAIPHPEPSYRAAYHFTTPDHWKNDPQKPVYLDGKYHYYYLYNRDYPDGNGTEWRHATSTDLVNWNDEGIAIPKYTNPNGDPWSGSIVVDEANTAGFGKGTVIAIMTQPSGNGGKQEQYLWYSTNRGKTFKPYGNGPVLANPGVKDYRDPKIVWDQAAHKWVMALAEGTKVGFYESGNLKEWHYTSSFVTENIGIVECPDLYMMRADDGSMKWILGASANGKSSGQPNTYAYWIGDFDGKKFSTDQQEPQWLDYGFDWYGAVTFEEGGSRDKYDHRYAMAWMNNWDYPHNTPTLKEGFNGTDSMVRQIKLTRSADHKYRLVSQPVDALQQRVGSIDSIEQIQVNGHKTLDFTGETYQLDADISWSEIKNVGFRLRESADRTRHVDVGLFVQGQYSYVNRASTGQPDQSGKYLESKAPFNASNKKVHHLKILVDRTSIEVFVDEGEIAFSNLIFPDSHDKGITLYTEGGTAAFNNVVIKHFK